MPRPVYTLCCELSIEERDGAISHLRLLERMDCQPLPKPEGQPVFIFTSHFEMVSVWERDENAPLDQEYDFEILASVPGIDEPLPLQTTRFRFTTLRQRFTVKAIPQQIVRGPGTLRIVSRVRPAGAGSEPWVTQEYRVHVNFLDAPDGPESEASKTVAAK